MDVDNPGEGEGKGKGAMTAREELVNGGRGGGLV